MIDYARKLIFIHIPKTGGGSIEKTFCHPYDGVGIHYDEDLTEELCKKFYMFTFVRNPWDRMVSQYAYRPFLRKHEFPYAVKYIEELYIEEYGEDSPELIHLLPQTELNGHKDLFKYVDFIGRFENLQEDFKQICKANGLSNYRRRLPSVHFSGFRPPYQTFYDEESKKIVEQMWGCDAIKFGYQFD